ILLDGPPTNAERLRYAFRLCVAREPVPAEADRLAKYLALQLDEFRAAPDNARAFLAGGTGAKARAAVAIPEGTDVGQLAAWTAVARVLLNLDEFITRE